MADAAKLSLFGPFVMRSIGARMTGIEDDRGSIMAVNNRLETGDW